MGSIEKVLDQVLRGTSDANIAFSDLRRLLGRLGFAERTKGSHHIFRREGLPELITLQEDQSKAKPYQVRQVRNIILKHELAKEI
jgi:predicted RNA binding protein YcfA (HicA-like mRNA interferase family)